MNAFLKKIRTLLYILTACVFFHSAYPQTHFKQPVINKYSAVTSILNKNPEDPDTVEVANPEHFYQGDYVLFIIMKGAEIYTPLNYPNIPSFWGKIMNINNTGVYSIQSVDKVEADLVILSTPLQNLNPMKPGEVAQLVLIPVVQTAILDTILTCKQWDHLSGTGGVLALIATRKIIMNRNIDVSGKGFRGADPSGDYFMGGCSSASDSFYTIDAVNSAGLKGEGIVYEGFPYKRGFWYVANAGGGGNGKYAGGGGGGNYGPGGWAGKELETCSPLINYGGGGRHIPPGFFTNNGSARNRLFMGGGGGTSTQNPDSSRVATPGGNGGGVIILITDTLKTFSGDTIFANGGSVIDTATAGAGGGGAGGMVVLDVSNYLGDIHIDVQGGNGGHTNSPEKTGPGGFGGGGFIWLSGNELPYNVTIDTANGKSGVWLPEESHYGAITSSQISGNILGNLILPITGTLFNYLEEKIVYCSEEITDTLPASAPKGGTGYYAFLWQQSEDKINWDTASGDYAFMDYLPDIGFDTMYFRRIVSSGSISDTSNIITVVHLSSILHNIIKGGGMACENQVPDPVIQGDTTLSGGTGNYSYLWEVYIAGGYIPAPGTNYNPDYQPPPLFKNTLFRRYVKSDLCFSYSNEVEFEIRQNPGIVTSPISDTIISGDSVIFHSFAVGSEPLNYQWMHNYMIIDMATGTELAINGATTNDTGSYYCIVENDCGLTITDTAHLLVIPVVSVKSLIEETDKPFIYPNPASRRISIDHAFQGDNMITVYSSSGISIKTFRNVSSIGLEEIPAGNYFIRIEYPEYAEVFIRSVLIIK